MFRVLFSVLLGVSAALAATDGPATLPLALPLSTMADTPAPGAVTLVTPGGLQQAINNAACGDTLQLPAGATFSGSYVLPVKSCDDAHWVVIRTSALDAALPPEGGRLNPCYAGVVSLPGRPRFTCPAGGVTAAIVAPKNGTPIILSAGANHYRLGPGLELTRAVGTGVVYNLISPLGAVNHLVVDRDWVHGTAQDETVRGILLSGITNAAVVGSYFSDFHCVAGIGRCTDAQAIAGGTGPLPSGMFLIENNFLEGAAETILFGGVLKNSFTPADITIRRNHMFKPLTWMPGQPGFVGGAETATAKCLGWDPTGAVGQCPFIVKNLFELKNAQRVLLEGNVLEHVWAGFTQHGHAILLSGLNPPTAIGETIYSTVSLFNITLRFNQVSGATSGVGIANIPTGVIPNLPVSKISIHDNAFDDLSPVYANGDNSVTAAMAFQLSNCAACVPLSDVSIDHVTMILSAPKIGWFLGATAPLLFQGIAITNNIVSVNPNLAVNGTGAGGPCGGIGATNLARINSCFTQPYSFTGNVLVGGTNTWPPGNFFPVNLAAVGLNPNLSLSAGSPFKGTATDGGDPGADAAKVHYATLGVE